MGFATLNPSYESSETRRHAERGGERLDQIELHAPAAREPIADPRIDEARRRRAERIVLGQRGRAEITPAQGAEPADRLADGHTGRCNDPRRIGNEVPRRVADLRLRKTGERTG